MGDTEAVPAVGAPCGRPLDAWAARRQSVASELPRTSGPPTRSRAASRRWAARGAKRDVATGEYGRLGGCRRRVASWSEGACVWGVVLARRAQVGLRAASGAGIGARARMRLRWGWTRQWGRRGHGVGQCARAVQHIVSVEGAGALCPFRVRGRGGSGGGGWRSRREVHLCSIVSMSPCHLSASQRAQVLRSAGTEKVATRRGAPHVSGRNPFLDSTAHTIRKFLPYPLL